MGGCFDGPPILAGGEGDDIAADAPLGLAAAPAGEVDGDEGEGEVGGVGLQGEDG